MNIEVVKPVPQPLPPNEYRLTLTHEEAVILRAIVGHISGEDNEGIREFISDIYHKLGQAGVSFDDQVALADRHLHEDWFIGRR
jgi:hypothetical protein